MDFIQKIDNYLNNTLSPYYQLYTVIIGSNLFVGYVCYCLGKQQIEIEFGDLATWVIAIFTFVMALATFKMAKYAKRGVTDWEDSYKFDRKYRAVQDVFDMYLILEKSVYDLYFEYEHKADSQTSINIDYSTYNTAADKLHQTICYYIKSEPNVDFQYRGNMLSSALSGIKTAICSELNKEKPNRDSLYSLVDELRTETEKIHAHFRNIKKSLSMAN